jgi:hypothetical protein
MQICQFLIGVSYAATHSFVSYTVPIQVPNIQASLTEMASVASTSVAAAASSPALANLVKKMLFRAVGGEGLAENVNAVPAQVHTQKLASDGVAQAYRTEYQTISCIDTSGQTFAIWLNVLYLAPLTVLFVRFFIKSYLRRSGKGSTYTTAAEKAEKAGKDALKGVGRELYTNGKAHGAAIVNSAL